MHAAGVDQWLMTTSVRNRELGGTACGPETRKWPRRSFRGRVLGPEVLPGTSRSGTHLRKPKPGQDSREEFRCCSVKAARIRRSRSGSATEQHPRTPGPRAEESLASATTTNRNMPPTKSAIVATSSTAELTCDVEATATRGALQHRFGWP